jgi:hypothetical protein
MQTMNLRPSVWLLAIAVGVVLAPAGADASVGGASLATFPAARSVVPLHTHITWKGYRGVRAGETLAHAAAQLHGAVKVDCVFRYVSYGGPVRMDNGVRSHSRRVEEMVAWRRIITGPRGVHVGMSSRRVRNAMGSQMRRFTTQEGGQIDLLVGPRGVTEWAAIYQQRAYSIGLSPTFTLAKRNAQIQGC